MVTNSKVFLLLLFFTSAFILFSCSSPTNPDLLPSLTITVDGVTSTEAFIKLSTNNISLPASVSLSRNNKQIKNFTLITADTTIVDGSLNPNQSYTYQASIQSSSHTDVLSESVTVTTMDTTSHNFSWQTFTFGGQGGSSTLYDVAIINENDIWAVGEMYVYDSTGTPALYNAVHYDGSKWELKRIKAEFRGNIITIELEGIFAFSPTDIWMVGSLPIHGDGQNWTIFDVRTTTDPNLSLSKAWGANTNDMYFVGRGGSIAHYKNGFWQKINSGTDLNIQDIWGDINPNTGDTEILCVASNVTSNDGIKLLKINNGIISEVKTSGLPLSIKSIWFSSGLKYFIAGDGLFASSNLSNSWVEDTRPPTYYKDEIRGSSINDIVLCGSNGVLSHFNGKNWYSYSGNEQPYFAGRYFTGTIKGNTIVVAGYKGGQAIITIGKR